MSIFDPAIFDPAIFDAGILAGGIPHGRRTMLHYRAPETPQETLATPENVPVLNWRKAKRLQRRISKVAPLHPPMAVSDDGEEAMILLLAA